MKRKLIIFDLDDTLLNDEHTASELTVRALNRVREMGHLTAFNTARSKMRSSDIFELTKPDYAIYNGGAHITDGEGNTVYEAEIEKDDCNLILKEISLITDRYSVQNADWFYSANEDYDAPDVKYFNFQKEEFPTGAYKIIAYCEDPDRLLPVAEKYGLDFVTYFGGPFCRFTKSGVNKAGGSRALAHILEIDIADVIAFGDDIGDFDMICEAGVGVLMKNANPSLIKISGEHKNVAVSKYSNDEDGVARFLADYFCFSLD